MMAARNSQTWSLKTITPLHIGDGGELQRDLDFIIGRDGLEMIDLESLLESASVTPGAIDEIGRQKFDLYRFITQYKLVIDPEYVLPFPSSHPPNSMRSFIKDAFGRPYVPGSSLKGALRTALWVKTLDRSRLPDSGDIRKFSQAVNRISGPSPHEDFLRPLYASDSSPGAPGKVLKAQEVMFLNVLSGDRPGWIDFSGRRQNRAHYNEARGIVVEAVKENQEFYVQISFDDFLRLPAIRRMARIPASKGLDGIESFCHFVNLHALEMISREKSFLEKYMPVTGPVIECYKNLEKRVNDCINHKNALIMRLSWGSGWKGMTGDWIDERELQKIRFQVRPALGKKGVDLFPKTRRLAVAGGIPSLPMGWVELRLKEQEDFRSFVMGLSIPESSTSSKPIEVAEEQQLKPNEAKKSKKEIREEKLDTFNTFLQGVNNIGGQVDDIINRILSVEDSELRKAMVEAVMKSAKKTKSFKKAQKSGKQWVQKIEKIANMVNIDY